ncbi:MAG TPA: hypothetical protein DCE41_37285 [Cytophagales bacterium]|nr:hypothetical protein [Cytophagales bacterium]HAA19855.1 hypothetical protein [Cytophagales bacterium]HAP65338.1 hypothetical protein [Cytophagales bacterium]
MRLTTTCLALVSVFLLTHCSSDQKSEDQEQSQDNTSESSAPTIALDLSTAEERLAALETQLSTLPGNQEDVTSQVAQFDEMGNLWKAPVEGYSGWVGDSAFIMGLGNFFQDSQNLALYHAQGRHNAESKVYKWIGTLQVAQSQNMAANSDAGTLQGISLAKYEFIENQGRPEEATYKGLAVAYYSFDPDSESIIKTLPDQLPAQTPSILFEGYRISNDSTAVSWTVWGLGEAKDIQAGIQVPSNAL